MSYSVIYGPKGNEMGFVVRLKGLNNWDVGSTVVIQIGVAYVYCIRASQN